MKKPKRFFVFVVVFICVIFGEALRRRSASLLCRPAMLRQEASEDR